MTDRIHKAIQIYLTPSEKEDFKKACKKRHTTMSAEVRRFARAFVNTPYVEERLYYRSSENEH